MFLTLLAKGEGVSALAYCRMRKLVAAGTELLSQGPGDVAIYIWLVSTTDEFLRVEKLLIRYSFSGTCTSL